MQLSGLKVLVLVSNGVDEGVMSNLQREMLKSGASVKTVGTESGLVNSWNNNNWGLYFPVDQQIGQVLGSDFDALIVPSGSRSIQKLAGNPHAERIVASFVTAQKPMVFIGDAVELLAKTELAKDWNVAGPEASREVMTAAGATFEVAEQKAHTILMTGVASDIMSFIEGMKPHMMSQMDVKAAA